jgi:hypothetical protein
VQDQLAGFRARLSAAEATMALPARPRAHRVWRVLDVACTAAAVLAAVVGLSLRPQVSFARVAENVLHRGPMLATFRRGEFEAVAEAIKAIVAKERVSDRPLEQLKFPGPGRDKLKVLEQGVKKVNEGVHEWLEFRLTVSYEGSTGPMQLLFRVDTLTKLPVPCGIETELDGKAAVVESRFDYPERGRRRTFMIWEYPGRSLPGERM